MSDSVSGPSSRSAAPLLLIDGYNLLYATDITGQGRDAGTLQASRQALLDFLVASLDSDVVNRTVIVFDAHNPPPGLPREVQQAGLRIHFATGFPNADELLKQYIAEHTSPRQLSVISSDHQVQRAARRRRASYVDSDVWYRKLRTQRKGSNPQNTSLASDKPVTLPSAAEVQQWLQEFDSVSETANPTPSSSAGSDLDLTPPDTEFGTSPFPPGYGDDLLAEDGSDEEDGFSLD